MMKKKRETDEILPARACEALAADTDGRANRANFKSRDAGSGCCKSAPAGIYVVRNKELLSPLSGVSSYSDYVKDAPLAICFKEAGLNPLTCR